MIKCVCVCVAPVPLSVLFLLVYSRIMWPMVLTLSLNMMPWACTMKKYVLAAEEREHKTTEENGL